MQRIEYPLATTAWAVYLQERMEVPAGGGYPGPDATEFIHVERAGGSGGTMVTQPAQMVFGCYAADADIAESMAGRALSYVSAAAGTRITMEPPVSCKNVTLVSAPGRQPDPDRPDLARYTFTVLTALKGAIISEGIPA